MSRKRSACTLLLVIALGLVACQTPIPEEPGIPNPASSYCEDQGGRIEIRETEGGQYGVCIFEDGSECDEWAFFRGECRPGDYDIAPTPVHVPSYVNDQYGFSLEPPPDYTVEGWDYHTLFKKPGYSLFVGYNWADEEVEAVRTGLPAGEFETAGSVTVLDTEIPRRVLIYEGKIKNVTYSPFQVRELQISVWLDAEVPRNGDYSDVDIPLEIQNEADGIVASFALLSGETPHIIILGGQ